MALAPENVNVLGPFILEPLCLIPLLCLCPPRLAFSPFLETDQVRFVMGTDVSPEVSEKRAFETFDSVSSSIPETFLRRLADSERCLSSFAFFCLEFL